MLEIALTMFDPLLLPVCKDGHCFKQPSLLQIKEFLSGKRSDVGLLPLLLPSLDVSSQDDIGDFQKFSFDFQIQLLSKLVESIFELLFEFVGLFLEPLRRRLLSSHLIEVISEAFPQLAVVSKVR